ncbi:MAG: hypothetical protein ACKV2V_12025 [Blastocatellia bacterium]
MVRTYQLNNPFVRSAVCLSALAVCLALAFLVTVDFVTRALSDWRTPADRQVLTLAAGWLPDSPRINARLAEAELAAHAERDQVAAHAAATLDRVIARSPWEFRYRLLQATALESLADAAGAESALRAALNLAPAHTETNWRLANLLVRQSRHDEAIPLFRHAITTQPHLAPAALQLLWTVTRGSVAAVSAAAGQDAKSQFALAQFLLGKTKPETAGATEPALAVASAIPPAARRAEQTSAASFISALLQAGHLQDAWRFWAETLALPAGNLAPDGDFDTTLPKAFSQFAWTLSATPFARISLAAAADQPGANGRALKIEFTGRDTTRLDGEIRRLLPAAPGRTYTVEFSVRTQDLRMPDTPRLTVMQGGAALAQSALLPAGTNAWQKMSFRFTAPARETPLTLTLRRIPAFAWDEPAKGTIWLDDFRIQNDQE